MRWEYMYIELPHGRSASTKVAGETVDRLSQIEAILNELGASGWEVVASSQVSTGAGAGRAPRFVLKRPVA